MCYLHRITLLISAVSLTLLTGCQTANFKSSPITQIDIGGQELEHISNRAQVQLTIRNADQVLEKAEFAGLRELPYTYTPKLNNFSEKLTADVSVSYAGKQVLHGSSELTSNQVNMLTLLPVQTLSRDETYWKAVDVSGRGIPPAVSTTIALREAGRISGFAGCNQYRGNYRTVSLFMEVQEIETTSNICAEPVMYHEHRYFKFLKAVEVIREENGQLLLYTSESDQPIVYTRIEKKEILLSLNKISVAN